VLPDGLDRFLAVGAGCHDLGFRLGLEQTYQPLPPHRLVICHHDP
jgi:hypothetical protein